MMTRLRGERRKGRHAPRLRRCKPGTYISSIDAAVQPGTRVVPWCRVSGPRQAARGNNGDQEAELRAAVEARGGVVLLPAHHAIGPAGACLADLHAAARAAAAASAVLLATDTSRLARHPAYNPKEQGKKKTYQRPGLSALRAVQFACGGVQVATLHPPDASPAEVRGTQTRRGQQQKGRKGGRPRKQRPGYKLLRRLAALPKVRTMKREGMSNREIAEALNVPRRTVDRWVGHFLRPRGGDGST